MDDLEGEVADEKFHECALGHDILTADLNCEDALLLNIRQHRVFGVAHNVGCLICGECIRKVPKPRFNVVSESLSAFVSHLDIAIRDSHSVHRMMIVDHHRLLRGLGVEDPHGDLLSSCRPFLSQIDLNVFHPFLPMSFSKSTNESAEANFK